MTSAKIDDITSAARKAAGDSRDSTPTDRVVETLHEIAHNCWTIRELCEFTVTRAGSGNFDPSTIAEAIRQIASLTGYLADRATGDIGAGEYHRIADDADWLLSQGSRETGDVAQTAARIRKAIGQN